MMDENITYEDAYKELVMICDQVNNEQHFIIDLGAKVKRAASLSGFCLAKLQEMEWEICH